MVTKTKNNFTKRHETAKNCHYSFFSLLVLLFWKSKSVAEIRHTENAITAKYTYVLNIEVIDSSCVKTLAC